MGIRRAVPDAVAPDLHLTALVPIEVWEYGSPYLKYQGHIVDLGLLAEALIYYDRVWVNLSTDSQFEALVRWFVSQGHLDTLIQFLDSGQIRFAYYNFMTTAIGMADGSFQTWNLQAEKRAGDFMRLVVYRAKLADIMNTNRRSRLMRALEGAVVEIEADDYGQPIEDARGALTNPSRAELLVQAFVDDLYPKLGRPSPTIKCEVSLPNSMGQFTIQTNLDFREISRLTAGKVDLRRDLPMIGEANSNRLMWTAARDGLDLYLGDVMGSIVGNKMSTVEGASPGAGPLIENLKLRVEFPDVRRDINARRLDLDFVLQARGRAAPFRKWLREEADRDRDELIAYHREVARASGWKAGASKTLGLFGYVTKVGVPGLAAAAGALHPELGVAAAGAGVGGAVAGDFMSRMGGILGREWRPVVFGDWLKDQRDRAIGAKRPK